MNERTQKCRKRNRIVTPINPKNSNRTKLWLWLENTVRVFVCCVGLGCLQCGFFVLHFFSNSFVSLYCSLNVLFVVRVQQGLLLGSSCIKYVTELANLMRTQLTCMRNTLYHQNHICCQSFIRSLV